MGLAKINAVPRRLRAAGASVVQLMNCCIAAFVSSDQK